MLRFLDGILMGTTSSAGADSAGGGSGGAAASSGTAPSFLSTLPEGLRAHAALKDIKDAGDLATRYADTQKPFAERLPEKIRGEAYFKDINSFDDLATKAYNQAKMIGRDPNTLISLPADDKAESWNEFYTKTGRPETADKYAIPKRADGKDYSAQDVAFQKQLLPALHEAGLSQRQIEALVPKWNGIQDAITKQANDAIDADIGKASEALRAKLGAAYDDTVSLAFATLEHYTRELKLGDELSRELDKTKLGSNPAMVELLAHFGKGLQQDGLLGKDGEGHGNVMSPAEAKQQISAKFADEKFMAIYRDKSHSGHAASVEEMKRLHDYAYPEPGN